MRCGCPAAANADEIQITETPAPDEVTQSCRLTGKERPQRVRPRNRQCSLSEQLEINGDTLVMQVTRRISPTTTALDALFYEWLGEYLPVTAPMLLALMGALIFTLRGAMRPLERLMRYARTITPAHAGVRLPTDDLPTELLGPGRGDQRRSGPPGSRLPGAARLPRRRRA